MTSKPEIIPPGDYKVRRASSNTQNTTYQILTGPFQGRFLSVPTHLVPAITLTVTVEEEVTTTERNVARFKTEQTNVFKTRPSGRHDYL